MRVVSLKKDLRKYANQEKNKVCKVCKELNCDNCALAFPENNSTIKPSQQNLEDYYIKAYSNENDQYEYLKDIYNKTKRKLKLYHELSGNPPHLLHHAVSYQFRNQTPT